jgi:hypothetical protein
MRTKYKTKVNNLTSLGFSFLMDGQRNHSQPTKKEYKNTVKSMIQFNVQCTLP